MAATVNWFYMKGEEKVGPVSQDVLCDMFRGGMLSLQTLVRSDAFTKWTPASSIAALRSLCSAQFPAPSLAAPTVPNGGRPVLDYDSTDSAGPIGIGGWLILPAIGLIIGPLLGLFSTLGLWWIGNQIANKGIGGSTGSIRIVAAVSTLFTLFQLYVAVLFFGKKRSAPGAMIFMYISAVLLSFFGIWMTEPLVQNLPGTQNVWLGMIKPICIALVWVPYFTVSKRVHRTFVN